jgi:hypothetical protein
MGYEFMDLILKWLDAGFFGGVEMNQLLNALDKLGYRKILEKSSAPPAATTFPQNST